MGPVTVVTARPAGQAITCPANVPVPMTLCVLHVQKVHFPRTVKVSVPLALPVSLESTGSCVVGEIGTCCVPRVQKVRCPNGITPGPVDIVCGAE